MVENGSDMVSEKPQYLDREGRPAERPAVAVVNTMSWERFFDLFDYELCARGKERVAGIEITERGLTIYFEGIPK